MMIVGLRKVLSPDLQGCFAQAIGARRGDVIDRRGRSQWNL